jgi:hypothetical protein
MISSTLWPRARRIDRFDMVTIVANLRERLWQRECGEEGTRREESES